MKVLQQATLGGIRLANHFVRSATGDALATASGFGAPALARLLAQLARGGVGLLIAGPAAVSAEGKAGIRQLCLWQDDHLPALLDMTASVKEAGGKIVLQISHAGLFAKTILTGQAPLAPTRRRQSGGAICREMSRSDITRTVEAFAVAAALAQKAGFDGVQVCAAHGHLLSAFLSPYYNHRRDEYGGTVENRSRFLREALQSIRKIVSQDFPVLVKVNVNDFLPGGLGVVEMLETAAILETAGVRAIELSGGTPHSGALMPARPGGLKPENEGYYREEACYYKEKIRIPLILGGGIRSLATAEQFLQAGVCDFIAMSRPLVCEPGLIRRWKRGNHAPSLCLSDNQCCLPLRAGKGLYCLTRVREQKKVQAA